MYITPGLTHASDGVQHLDPVAPVIFWVTLIFLSGVIGKYIAHRLNQPSVLGELLMGVLIGNLCYHMAVPVIMVLREGSSIFSIMPDIFSETTLYQAVNRVISNPIYAHAVTDALNDQHGVDYLQIAYALDIFSRYGVIFLLFMVGLESSFEEIKKTGRESTQVAVIGVVAPIILGLLAMRLMVPDASLNVDLFVAATLSATSIGITASVLREIKKLATREARTILGAAMLDDVLGLIILAVISSVVVSGTVNVWGIGQIIVLSILFFALAIVIGPWLIRLFARWFSFLLPWESKLFVSFIFLMSLSWFATLMDLSSIIGAFTAGVILHDGYFDHENQQKKSLRIQQLIAPLEFILAPIFFVLIGIQVKLELFFHLHVLMLASGLIFAAIIGKLISGLGGNPKDDRLLIGIGMLPRGEVGLVFASIGRTFGVISDQLFSAIILMILVTTLIVPPWLKVRFTKRENAKHAA